MESRTRFRESVLLNSSFLINKNNDIQTILFVQTFKLKFPLANNFVCFIIGHEWLFGPIVIICFIDFYFIEFIDPGGL